MIKCLNCFYGHVVCAKRDSVYFNYYIPGFGCKYFITPLQKERNSKLKRLKKKIKKISNEK